MLPCAREILEGSGEKWPTVKQPPMALEYSDHGKLIHRIHHNRAKDQGKTTMLNESTLEGKRSVNREPKVITHHGIIRLPMLSEVPGSDREIATPDLHPGTG